MLPHHPLDPPREHGPALVTDIFGTIKHDDHDQHHEDDGVAQCGVGEGLENADELQLEIIWDRSGAEEVTKSHITKPSYL